MNTEYGNKRKLYIIPGYGESTRMKDYREIISRAEKKNYEVVALNIDWDTDKVMSDYITEAKGLLVSANENDAVLGFSFGAYIAYQLSDKIDLYKYIFATISPFIEETINEIPKETSDYYGPKMIDDFKKYTLHEGNSNEAIFLTGEKDWELAIEINTKASNLWKGKSKFILVNEAGHEIGHKNYSAKVCELI